MNRMPGRDVRRAGSAVPARSAEPVAGAPLDAARLRDSLVVPGGLWTRIEVVASTGSTNQDVLALARSGSPEGLVVAAETQTSGRGRLGRTWQSLPGAALTFSVLLRPSGVPPQARGWIPLLAGVCAAAALDDLTGIRARLKWPNDVLAGDGKLAGILAEQAGDAVVVGIGVNVGGSAADLPVPTATSLELLGAGDADRTGLLVSMLRQIGYWYPRWRDDGGDADGCGLRAEYLRLSATVGTRVRVLLPGGRILEGTAAGIDETGRLLVRAAGEVVPASAGDVIHLR